jgi:hypothetical protein
VWQENETREAFLMHVMAVLDAIKKHGHFHDYKKLRRLTMKQRKPLSQPGLVYPCSKVPEQGQEGSARRRLKKPPRKLFQRPKTPSWKPRKLMKQPR